MGQLAQEMSCPIRSAAVARVCTPGITASRQASATTRMAARVVRAAGVGGTDDRWLMTRSLLSGEGLGEAVLLVRLCLGSVCLDESSGRGISSPCRPASSLAASGPSGWLEGPTEHGSDAFGIAVGSLPSADRVDPAQLVEAFPISIRQHLRETASTKPNN